MKNAGHIAELDGIRGIAILMVFVFHSIGCGIRPPEGWFTELAVYGISGVDLFFVLSGFLITGILLNAKGKPAYFRNFYARRALRIWPLYCLMLAVAFGLGGVLERVAHLPLSDLALLKNGNRIMYVFLLQNLWYYRIPILLGVTWSLAIEEQFYVVWPWIVLYFNRKNLALIATMVLGLSPFVRLWAIHHGVNPESIHFLTWYRLDGLSVGALIAIWCKSDLFSLIHAKRIALASLVIGTPILILSREYRAWPLMFSMYAIVCAGLLTLGIWSNKINSAWGGPLRLRWLRFIGKISYCVYLIHVPVLYIVDARLAKYHLNYRWDIYLISFASSFIVCLTIATLSWYLFETQLLKLKDKLEYRRNSRIISPKNIGPEYAGPSQIG
jgi:peptidoglycan/LPS O-acetylase OafA/YrhL